MNTAEAAMILAVLRVSYPHSFKNFSAEDVSAAVALWAEMFSGESYEAVSAAVKTMIATRQEGYSPTIGEVKEYLRNLRKPEELNESAAWALVVKACENGYYGYKKEFEKLPPMVQKAVGHAEQLREWAQMDTSTFQSVVGSNFRRTYRTECERQRQDELMPESIKRLVGKIAGDRGMLQIGGTIGR